MLVLIVGLNRRILLYAHEIHQDIRLFQQVLGRKFSVISEITCICYIHVLLVNHLRSVSLLGNSGRR